MSDWGATHSTEPSALAGLGILSTVSVSVSGYFLFFFFERSLIFVMF